MTVIRGRMVTLAALALVLGCYAPGLVAQQYCASGAITSVSGCNSCNFNVGDPVAMTVIVTPSSITCMSLGTAAFPALTCIADAAFSVDIGMRHWTLEGAGGAVDIGFATAFDGSTSSSILIDGSALLSPLPAAPPPDAFLTVNLSVSGLPGDLLTATGSLPAALPSPSAVSASPAKLIFDAATGGGTPFFSYTGHTCAAGTSPLPPAVSTGGVVPLYSSSNTIQPGSWVSIFGSNLAAAPATWNDDFPTTLGHTSVMIDNKPAYLWYVSPGQINLQAPDDAARGTVSVVVTTDGGSATSTVTLGDFSPSFSLLDGKHVAGIILRTDGSGAYGGGTYDIVGPTGTSLGYKTVAAKSGDVLELFGVGFGPTNPPVPAGQSYSGAAVTTNPVQLLINNATVAPTFAGLTSAGLYQINLQLPAGLGAGDVPLLAAVGGVQTPTGVVLSVQ